ncbi:MAG: ATP-binding cassette domain-containing protein [Clostridiales bacterium]|jgi:ABC-type multidrug transport system ATPase subunit|nr:ATP-binding cassette domain-containing protein [Clostridiales bacterium]
MNCYSLSAEHIRKRYGGNTVLRDVSVHVKQGEIYGLVGRNGAGKTTLLRVLTGLIQEYDGMVSVGRIDSRPSKVSAVINTPALFLNLSAAENMREQSYLLGLRSDTLTAQALITVGLENCGKKPVKTFSLGMMQRLKLGMALLKSPDILILDEPANGLDPEGIAELRELLLHLNQAIGMTIMISSHILSELAQLATCLGILHNGVIVKEMSLRNFSQNGTTLEELYMQHTKGRQ